MAEHLSDCQDVDAALEEPCGSGVAEIVEPDHAEPGLGGDRGEGIADQGDTIITRLRTRCVEVIDKRPLGGALWMVGGPELNDLAAELALQGYAFHYTGGGSRATHHRAAWYLRRT